MELKDYVYTIIYLAADGTITSLYDNNPIFSKGYEIPEELIYDNYYLMITNKESGMTEITKLNETGEPLFRKGPLFLLADVAEKSGLQTLPTEDKEIFDKMQMNRWYGIGNVSGIVTELRGKE